MSKKSENNLETTYSIDKYNDQRNQIKDSLDIIEDTDSETTNLLNFRIINTGNGYPFDNESGDDNKH